MQNNGPGQSGSETYDKMQANGKESHCLPWLSLRVMEKRLKDHDKGSRETKERQTCTQGSQAQLMYRQDNQYVTVDLSTLSTLGSGQFNFPKSAIILCYFLHIASLGHRRFIWHQDMLSIKDQQIAGLYGCRMHCCFCPNIFRPQDER